MEDYNNLHQNPHPCNFQEIMELCSATVSTSPINAVPNDDRRLMNDSNSAWRRSFSAGGQDHELEASSGGRPAADGRWSSGLPPFCGKIVRSGEKSSGGDGSGGGNSEQILYGRNVDPNMDPRKLKRIMSNRVSAQKSRLKKVQYVADMERKLKALEAHIAVLSPQVEMYRNQQHMLQMEQKRLNQKILNCSRNKLMRDAEIEENRAEVNRLRELHMKQQNEGNNIINPWDNNNDNNNNNNTAFQMPTAIHASELSNVVSPHPNQLAEYGERTVGENGLDQFNSIARPIGFRRVEYKWMPTPGLRQVSEPNFNQLGPHGMGQPN